MMAQEQFDNLSGSHHEVISGCPKRKEYGKLHILTSYPIHISVGPNYGQFMMGFGMLILVAIFLTIFIIHQIDSHTHQLIGKIFAFITPLLYLLTALSNPGVYKPSNAQQSKTRYCHTCLHYTNNKVRHCHKCDVCIEGYDHHCPFMSKCVGKGNILYFYIFTFSLSLYSFYLYYSLYIGLTSHHGSDK